MVNPAGGLKGCSRAPVARRAVLGDIGRFGTRFLSVLVGYAASCVACDRVGKHRAGNKRPISCSCRRQTADDPRSGERSYDSNYPLAAKHLEPVTRDG